MQVVPTVLCTSGDCPPGEKVMLSSKEPWDMTEACVAGDPRRDSETWNHEVAACTKASRRQAGTSSRSPILASSVAVPTLARSEFNWQHNRTGGVSLSFANTVAARPPAIAPVRLLLLPRWAACVL